jgi:hypothetical protein
MTQSKTKQRTFTDDERASLLHCLNHLINNTIDTDAPDGRAWFYGNRGQFIKRHKKAIALVESLLRGKRTTQNRRKAEGVKK